MSSPAKTRVSAAEFFQLPETNIPTELIDGEIIVSPAPIPTHQRILRFTVRLLEGLIPNGEIFPAPIDVYFDDANIPQPDIVWIAEGGRCKVTDKRLEGAPDLVVEIHSPSTTRRDKTDKFDLYEKHGVREYWMIDPAAAYVEVYRLDNDAFVKVGIFGPDQTFESVTLGKTVDLKAVFTDQ
jgi:Uma2 family endonuclease